MTQEKCIFDIMRLSQTCLFRIVCIRNNSIIFCTVIRIICIVLFEIDVLYISTYKNKCCRNYLNNTASFIAFSYSILDRVASRSINITMQLFIVRFLCRIKIYESTFATKIWFLKNNFTPLTFSQTQVWWLYSIH